MITRRSQYERDSEALDAIYRHAYAELAQRFAMDDDEVTKLISLVLHSYFSGDYRGAVDQEAVAATVVQRFGD